MALRMAITPDSTSSPDTVGPTTSTRRYSTSSPSACLTAVTACCWVFSPPGRCPMRISTSSGAPNSWI